VLLGMAVPFFFDTNREMWGLGSYVLLLGVSSFWFGRHPIAVQDTATIDAFSTLNLITGIVLIVVFVRILQQENMAFENNIIQQNTLLGQQKEEIEAQRDQLSEMNHEISLHNQSLNESNTTIAQKNKTITDSIRYAQRIQTAIMPSPEEFKRFFPQSFIIYKPKDMIGGDFYWAEKVGDVVFWAVADCTGHGVPGALMSMLGANLLSQIVAHTQEPLQILEALDASIRKQLRQDVAGSDIRDGMDIAICRLDAQHLQFASAQRPVVLSSKGQLVVVKGSKNPIGSGIYEHKTFSTHTFARQEIQGIYLYTDGCTDLFDATNTCKLGSKRWLQWLEESSSLPLPQQEEVLRQKIAAWAGHTAPIDDLLSVGVWLQQ
jgi:serine phosphatase RsbU (regulator of sigma subunit)